MMCKPVGVALVAVVLATAVSSQAQPQPEQRQPAPTPDEPQPAEPDPEEPKPETELPDTGPDLLAEALEPAPGGLTLEAVASQAVRTSHGVAQRRAEMEEAAGALDEALVAYFPTATLSATYTRLSEVDNELSAGIPGAPPIEFPVILNSYELAASLTVPLSDYLLRLTQTYAAAEQSVEAKRHAVLAEELIVRRDAQLALLEWVRAKGQTAVAQMAVQEATAHLEDARIIGSVGKLARADLLRLDAQLAQAEHLERAARALEAVAKRVLRSRLHAKSNARFESGIDVLAEPPGDSRKLAELERLALQQRLDLKALETQERALDEADTAAHAAYYPRLDAFGNALYANPNPRIFPQEEKWDFTWEVGARLTWTINDTFSSMGATRKTRARMAAVREQKGLLSDSVALAVTNAYYDGVRARSAVKAADRREESLAAAREARRAQFRAGRANSTDIVDAEIALTRARLQRIDAHIDARVAAVNLAYAIGASR